jgi:hypothetical protein
MRRAPSDRHTAERPKLSQPDKQRSPSGKRLICAICNTNDQDIVFLRAFSALRPEQKRKDAKKARRWPRNALRILAFLRVFALCLVAARPRWVICGPILFTTGCADGHRLTGYPSLIFFPSLPCVPWAHNPGSFYAQKSRQRLHAGGSNRNNQTPFKPLPSETGSHR